MARYTIDTRPGPIDFECNSEPLKRLLQSCKNLLMCHAGEVPYDRRRGLDPAILDLSVAEANEYILPEVDRVLEWEPKARAVSAEVSLDENGAAVVTVVLDINL